MYALRSNSILFWAPESAWVRQQIVMFPLLLDVGSPENACGI